MKGIRDLTSRLPIRLDQPRWRAPLPNVTELAPGWRRHDRTHLEISLEHRADGREWTWEAWVFLPRSFRLDADTCSQKQLGSDIQSRVRFSAPPLELEEVADEVDRLVVTISATPTGGADEEHAVDELKIFACRLREAIARRTFDLRKVIAEEPAGGGIDDLAGRIERALASIRGELVPAAARAGGDVAKTAQWVDEHLSHSFEAAMIKLAGDLAERRPPPPELAVARDAAVAEARYRAEVGAGPSVSADSVTLDLEQVERRQHALKRLTSSVLWLRPEIRDERRGAEHALHAIAAGIAMAFALTAALLYGAPEDATDVWVWAGLVVLAYMGKDRLKAALQDAFSRRIDRRYPSRSWIVRDRHDVRQIASAGEKYRFVDAGELPADVVRFRDELLRDTLGERIESDSILHHHKSVVVDAGAVRATDTRFGALTEILRIDVSRWLTHTDDPSRAVTLADPGTGELFASELPRAYDVLIVHRLGLADANPSWAAARVVLSRNGIRRVDQLDD